MLQKFAFIFVLLLLVPDAYIYWHYIKKWAGDKKIKLLWWLPSVILIIGFIGARYIGTDNPMSDRQGIIAWLGILILCIGVPKIIFMLIDLWVVCCMPSISPSPYGFSDG